MSAITIDDNELKALLKQALIELLEEKSDLFYEALAEVIEESGLVKAIKEACIEKARPEGLGGG